VPDSDPAATPVGPVREGGVQAGAELTARANALIAYHAPIAQRLTEARTSLESRLIPVTAYIVVACTEAFFRYPEMMRRVDTALPAAEIGARGRRPGVQVNTVYLWSIANFWLTGRKVVAQLDPSRDEPDDAVTVLQFWEQAALAFRGGDGTRQAADAGGTVRPYSGDVISTPIDAAEPVSDERRTAIKRFNATLVSYLFLMYFDTRVGTGNTGPWPLPDGRTLMVRDYYRLGHSDLPWSGVASDVPYGNLTAALVLDADVSLRITDFGTADTQPEDYLDHLVGFSLFTTDERRSAQDVARGAPIRGGGPLQPVAFHELDAIVATVRKAQATLYRTIAAMSRDAKVRAGAHVYFTFLKPFADEAGVGDALDWTVPRDLPDGWYQFLSMMEGGNETTVDAAPYYEQY